MLTQEKINNHNYAVFPLNTVLFPGCYLSLRIFEQRYLRMISECGKADLPFIIALIKKNEDSPTHFLPSEVGEMNTCHDVGCSVRIADFSQNKNGMLDIVVRAGSRVKVDQVSYEPDCLMKAKLTPIDEPQVIEFTKAHKVFIDAFNTLKLKDPYLAKKKVSTLSATELSFFITHFLPIPLPSKQKLLALRNTEARFAVLKQIMSKLQTTFTA